MTLLKGGTAPVVQEVRNVLARPGLASFEYIRASTPQEVIHLLGQYRDGAKLMMGGTDLLVRVRSGSVRPQVVIDVKGLPGMRDVVYDASVGLTIGAAVTMNQLALHPDVQAHYPLLAEAANTVAGYQVRNRATVGGNLCNASPCADMAPATLVLEGQLVLHGVDGERRVLAGAFFAGPGQTTMGAGEWMTAIRFPVPPVGAAASYLKLGRNRMGDLALVSVAVLGFRDEAAPAGARFRIALGSVAPVPLRVPEAEQLLAASAPGKEAFERAAEKAAEAARPIDDVRSSAAYRRAMVRYLTQRGLQDVWEQLANHG